MITIRPSQMSDIHDLGILWNKMHSEELGPGVVSDYLFWELVVGQAIHSNKDFVCFIAIDDDSPVGFIMGNRYYEPSDSRIHGISQHIYVLPEYRNTGTAMRLYRSLAKTFKTLGVQVISLYCLPARTSFWIRKGFKPVQTMFSKELKHD